MKNALYGLSNSQKSSAKVVDGKLVLSCPGALNPIVWQMDFAHVKASALEVNENKNDGSFALKLKTPKGENVQIAPFAKKEEAVQGLMAASKALENAQGKIHAVPTKNTNSQTPHTQTPEKSASSWIPAILGLALLIILLFVWSALSPHAPSSINQSVTPGSAASSANSTNGVPLSADDFLKGR